MTKQERLQTRRFTLRNTTRLACGLRGWNGGRYYNVWAARRRRNARQQQVHQDIRTSFLVPESITVNASPLTSVMSHSSVNGDSRQDQSFFSDDRSELSKCSNGPEEPHRFTLAHRSTSPVDDEGYVSATTACQISVCLSPTLGESTEQSDTPNLQEGQNHAALLRTSTPPTVDEGYVSTISTDQESDGNRESNETTLLITSPTRSNSGPGTAAARSSTSLDESEGGYGDCDVLKFPFYFDHESMHVSNQELPPATNGSEVQDHSPSNPAADHGSWMSINDDHDSVYDADAEWETLVQCPIVDPWGSCSGLLPCVGCHQCILRSPSRE